MPESDSVTGNVPVVPSDPVASTNDAPLPWPEWLMIENGRQDVPWPRPRLWTEVMAPRVLAGVSPLVRYVAFLYYDLGKGDRAIGRLVGLHYTTVHELRQSLKRLTTRTYLEPPPLPPDTSPEVQPRQP